MRSIRKTPAAVSRLSTAADAMHAAITEPTSAENTLGTVADTITEYARRHLSPSSRAESRPRPGSTDREIICHILLNTIYNIQKNKSLLPQSDLR